jgi:hypothetical protein
MKLSDVGLPNTVEPKFLIAGRMELELKNATDLLNVHFRYWQ